MIYELIRHQLASEYPVKVCCRVLGVSTSGYYHARARGPSRRACRHARLVEEVRVAHAASRGIYGSPRIAHALRQRGVRICRNTAAVIMRHQGLRSRRSRRFRPSTTDSSATLKPSPNLLDRCFHATTPDAVWLADITYLPLQSGFAYLAAIMDLHSRAIVGWALDRSLGAHLATRALEAAVARRRPPPGTVHHSDRGVQYDSIAYRTLLQRHGLVQSMSRRADCYDNAPMESFFATLKSELIGSIRYPDIQTAHDHLFAFIEGFYLRQRLHSALGYATPLQSLTRTISPQSTVRM